MTIQEIFIGSEEALTKVVNQIKDDQWEKVVPPVFAKTSRKTEGPLTLRVIINYHAYDDAWVPDTLSGKTISEVGDKYNGDLLGQNPKESWRRIVDSAEAAVRETNDLTKQVHLSYGDFSTKDYLTHIISFRALRAVDIARVIGVEDKLPDDLAQAVLDLLSPDAEAFRQMGVYEPKVEVPENADAFTKLLGLTGRKP